ncbi:MAG: nucleotide sugar dehydrogenase [Bryobacterales bacterium]|nr:nucleotide sugar dehydrogenase [Bryobacterales bacterium]
MNPLKVAVLGMGYVGCVTAACLAKMGVRVAGVDKDAHKVENVLQGRAPFYEPGLQPIIEETIAAGLLTATTDIDTALEGADIALLCVGTPSARNGNLSTEQLERATAEIRGARSRQSPETHSKRLIVAVRSTVFPGTCDDIVLPALGSESNTVVVANPEFLREGTAVKDFLVPSLVVVGGEDKDAVRTVASLYDPLGFPTCEVSLRTAEAIKYGCNAFHAVKISFANEFGSLCTSLGVSPSEVMETLCRDEKLNISTAYLRPGFAFGGSCLPKDLRALTYRAGRLDLSLPMLEAVLPSNSRHLQRSIQAVLDTGKERVGVFGLAFKENTDDLRESPVVTLIEQIYGKGRKLFVFDPHIKLDEIYGTNRNFVFAAVPHIGKLVVPSVDEMIASSEVIVLTQSPGEVAADRIQASGLPVLDFTRL